MTYTVCTSCGKTHFRARYRAFRLSKKGEGMARAIKLSRTAK